MSIYIECMRCSKSASEQKDDNDGKVYRWTNRNGNEVQNLAEWICQDCIDYNKRWSRRIKSYFLLSLTVISFYITFMILKELIK